MISDRDEPFKLTSIPTSIKHPLAEAEDTQVDTRNACPPGPRNGRLETFRHDIEDIPQVRESRNE